MENLSPVDAGQEQHVERKWREARFYRPELDALRFFAFLGVLIHHGPANMGLPDIVRRTGGYGLSLFFLLSAYLITELLLREHEQHGTISWRFFFVRRALRIWPLYYTALVAGIVTSHIPPRHFPVSGSAIAGMAVFVFNWLPNSWLLASPLLFPLWSISVEEQFYLIWPPIVKFGGKKLIVVTCFVFVIVAVVWLWVFSAREWNTWYDTPVEFVYFAAGAVIALAVHGKRPPAISLATRLGILTASLFVLAIAAWIGRIADDRFGPIIVRLYLGYGLGVVGSSAIFLATMGLTHIPRALIYLGRISYGLYVFHNGALILARILTIPLKLASSSFFRMFVVDGLGFLICLPLAVLSYHFLEKPFLKLKVRFEKVRSRPI